MSTIRHRPDRRECFRQADRARSIRSWEYLWFLAFFCLPVDEPPVGPLANTKTLLTSDSAVQHERVHRVRSFLSLGQITICGDRQRIVSEHSARGR